MAVIDVQRPSKAPQGNYSSKPWGPYTRKVERDETGQIDERRVEHSPKKVSERRANIKPVALPTR
jgi:hypothetical protein